MTGGDSTVPNAAKGGGGGGIPGYSGPYGGGGGAGGVYDSGVFGDGGAGGNGAVRIVWPGSKRTYPSTDVALP